MSVAYAVLLILLIIYIPIWVWAWRRPEAAAKWHLQKYGPCIMIRTHLGLKAMDRLASYPRVWRVFGFLSKFISAALFLMMMYMLIVSIIALPARLSSGSSIGIEYALAIPGFNPILPLSYGIAALLIAMVVHEMGHGIQARVHGMKVDSSGVLYGVVPLGAFVEPNEKDLNGASRGAQLDVYTAGITMNTILAVASILIMIFACGCVSSDYGDAAGAYAIDADSPAYFAGIPASGLIIGISDSEGNILAGEDAYGHSAGKISTVSQGTAAYIDYPFDPTQRYILTYLDHGDTKATQPIQMGAYIKTIGKDSPADKGGLTVGTFFYSMIHENGEEVLIHGPNGFKDFMNDAAIGEKITVVTVDYVADGEIAKSYHEVTLGSRGSVSYIGISATTAGMTLTTPDILMDKAVNPFYGASTGYEHVTAFFSYLSGPFNGMDPISDEVKWWYDAPMGGIFWVIVSMLYWLFWLDILLAISNALPTFILDGGFIFAGGLNWVLEKFGVADGERRSKLTDSIAGSVSSITLFMFMLVILAMVI